MRLLDIKVYPLDITVVGYDADPNPANECQAWRQYHIYSFGELNTASPVLNIQYNCSVPSIQTTIRKWLHDVELGIKEENSV